MFDWNDIRLFLAIAESGSALGAARLLGLNQTTVARRMDALECQLGLTLFERRNLGYRLTEEGKSLRALAAPMAECATEIMALSVTNLTASILNSRLNFRLVISTLQFLAHDLIFVSTKPAAGHPCQSHASGGLLRHGAEHDRHVACGRGRGVAALHAGRPGKALV